MKPSNETVVEHTGTFVPQRSQVMTIDQDSIRYILSTLTNMYSDTELAPIREYSTNALDSHRAAGNTAPIEIELPSAMRPMFIVRDFGLGMSVDEITENYSKYGYSTKRDTNDAVGILGIGCKSGLTYTNQFSLVAVKNGVQTSVQISRGEDGVGRLDVLDTRCVDAPDGVEISIPVKDWQSFSRKAREFFRFWETGTVVINGQDVESVWDGGTDGFLTLDPDIIVTKELGTNYIVMGNIPYPVTMDAGIGHTYKVVARVPIGEIDFTPSRESLHLTPRTKAVVQTIADFVKERVGLHVQNELDAAPTPFEALKVQQTWRHVQNNFGRTYKGTKLPSSGIRISGFRWTPRYGHGQPARKTDSIGLDELVDPNTVTLRDHPRRSMDADTKSKLKELYPNVQVVYVISDFDNDNDETWIDGVERVSWFDIKPPKQPRGPRGPRNVIDKSTWWVRTPGMSAFAKQDTATVPVTGDICYVLRSEASAYLTRDAYRNYCHAILSNLKLGTTLALLSSTDVVKFMKQYPNARHAREYIRDAFVYIESLLTDDQIKWGLEAHDLTKHDPDKIVDPDVKDLITRLNTCISGKDLLLARQYMMNHFSKITRELTLPSREGKCKSKIPDLVQTWQVRYPLVAGNGCYGTRGNAADELECMNALYHHRKEGK